VIDSQASRHRSRPSPRRAQQATIPARASPRHSRHRLLLCRHPATAAVVRAVRGAAHATVGSTSWESPPTPAAPGWPSRRATFVLDLGDRAAEFMF
jgi:hypothetical protein